MLLKSVFIAGLNAQAWPVLQHVTAGGDARHCDAQQIRARFFGRPEHFVGGVYEDN